MHHLAVVGTLDLEVFPLVAVDLAVDAEVAVSVVELEEQPGFFEGVFVVVIVPAPGEGERRNAHRRGQHEYRYG